MAKVTEREVRFARAFLKSVGGNQSNGYLLLAVIAWIRAEVGVNFRFMRGNNPFNIRRSSYASGYTQTRGNGSFAIFKNLTVAAKATVAFLIKNARFGNYNPILKAARRRGGNAAIQARDFLMAIAMSKWSAGHYGWKPAKPGRWLTRALPNGRTETIWVKGTPEKIPSLIKIWAGLTGTKIPDSWFIDKVTTTVQKKTVVKVKVKDKVRQPRSLLHAMPEVKFLQPYASRSFYEAKPHYGQYVLEQDVEAGTLDA